MKLINLSLTIAACYFSTNANAIEYMSYGSFNDPIQYNYHIQDCNGSISQGYGYGYYGKGVKFHRNGNVTTPTCQWKGRTELYANKLQDVPLNEYRWYGFSFKVADDSALDGPVLGDRYAIIQQFWSPTAATGPKMEFYLSKLTGKLTLNFKHSIKCSYSNASQFVNSEGESLCGNERNNRKIYFKSIPVEKGKWYYVRMGISADAPLNGKTVANGDIRAAVKQQGGSWQAFSYYGPNGRTNYFKTFTHELTANGRSVQPNSFKFGWYGPARPNSSGVIYFDEVYSNSYFGGLPSQYRN
ncbi:MULTISPECIES: heparin lyase I family protein [Pseudoalteromonas]|uniref:Polysaccharide lyase n=1 Tax=Pseudoalteromonas luteoviolacea (strain 2ta16) TaxID=1353533 RepID=V4JEA6_PSEL2|nr:MULTISPECIES: heparin lyase I family protein [Pseudoalteromonas]ESP93357.1 hypothetical protein PL2TA16_03210 [Pseudoalteromonas luteoviolacea 2ta16]KZN33620.1 hypothetical protein N483_26245 [Pseudoalteromonas luteoviolacea NCIMB 1944]MCG7551080.1 polysaccharide lyase [Pseudoalteromonas sp. Of7M-16]